ncbi:MAG: LamG-like jellyroll fold domain-containing protein [Desulfosalsimonadaceae bacterium]
MGKSSKIFYRKIKNRGFRSGTIYVKPLPQLELDYFLTKDVFGDDAFTTPIEPSIPFTLGVRIKNNGEGAARKLKIDSAQPKIVENNQGLLIGFALTGSQVNGEPASKSLLVDFGDLEPNKASVGRWIMTCTLSGSFIDFTADISHSDELGGELTSLIKQEDIHTHFLVKDVLVDLPGRDGINDFLAEENNLYKVYESESTDTVVTDLSSSSNLESPIQSGSEIRYTLSMPATMGFIYSQVADPFGGDMVLKQVIRNDGKQIKPDNAWLSKTRTNPQSSDWSYHVNLFDVNATGSYTFIFDEMSSVSQAPVLQFIPDKSRVEGEQLSFITQASDPNGTTPYLSASPLPAGATFVDLHDGTGVFDWTPALGQSGRYFVVFKASDGVLESSQRVKISVCSTADSDCDGMENAWEIDHFGDLSQDGTGDFDGDGISDLDEFLNGTNPDENDYGPSVPAIFSPAENTDVTVLTPELVIENSSDPNGDSLTYEFEVFSDPDLVDRVAYESNVAETPNTTLWGILNSLQDNKQYYWRVRAFDGAAYSLWAYGSFFVNTGNNAPSAFQISSPADNRQVDTLAPYFEVTNSKDVDRDTITYSFKVYSDSAMTDLVASASGITEESDGATGWTVSPPLNNETQYFWKVIAEDEHGAQNETSPAVFIISTVNHAPSAPTVLFPQDGIEITTHEEQLTVTNSIDSDGVPLTYSFELDEINTFDSPAKITEQGIVEGVDSTSWDVSGLESNTWYFWRARSNDEFSDSSWATGKFFVNPANDSPLAPTLRNPGNDAWVQTSTPQLAVNPAIDLDGDNIVYRFEVYSDATLTDLIDEFESENPQTAVSSELNNSTRYYWRVQAVDEHGATSVWMETATFFVKLYRWPGVEPQILFIAPSENIETSSDSVMIGWDDLDPDSNAIISLYYDNNNSGADGILIADNLEEDTDGSSDSFAWDVTAPEFEGTWYIYATISDEDNSMTAYAPGSVTINRVKPTIDWETGFEDVPEDAGSITLTASLNKASSKEISVPYTVSGTATGGGKDHGLSNGTLIIPAGNLTGTLLFTLNDDSLLEGSETILVSMGTPVNADFGTATIKTITIIDNESIPSNANLFIYSNTTDGDPVFTDSSTYNHAVTKYGDVHHGDSVKFDNSTAMSFDGAGDYLKAAGSSDWNFGTGDFTIDLWVNFASAPDLLDGVFSTCKSGTATGYLMAIYGTLQWYSPATGWMDTGLTPAVGRWNHLAVVRFGNTVKVYVDGVMKVSKACTGSINSESDGLVMGRYFTNYDGYYFGGYMDEVSVSKGFARWTADFTPPNHPAQSGDYDLDGITDTDEIIIYGTNCLLADTDGDGINDGAELAYWGIDWNTDYDGDGLNNLKDADADNDGVNDGNEVNESYTSPSDAASRPDTLLSKSKLYMYSDTTDGSTVFTDSSPVARTVTVSGNTQHAGSSMFGGSTAMSFDGTGDYLKAASSSDWNFGTGDFTIDLWVNFASVPDAFDGVFSASKASVGGYLMNIYNGTLQWYSPATGWMDTGLTPAVGRWNHLAVVRFGNTVKIYVDGVMKVSKTCTGSINSESDGLVLGRLYTNYDGYNFGGYMDEVSVSKGFARWTADFTPPNHPAP